jgi:DNA mismatch repair protein MutL
LAGGRIKRLSEELANQIAAGEVVERPANVVKELIENAIDAGATRVVIDVEQGGSTLVRVTDDGEGMIPEDALLALERHATSKIASLEDLDRIVTFGFRGEALPSIASVSRLTLRTRARGGDEGVEVSIEGGASPRTRPAGGAVGTMVEVRDLFFNVPARRKFLKATATESAHIGDVVLDAALSRPEVTFLLSRDGRVVRELLRAGSREERARLALSGEQLVAVDAARASLRIQAMLAPPERARAGATGLELLVNGRPVRDRHLARAVAHAYGSVLEGGRFPVGVVWLDLPADEVDVNVHPQKAEVRFASGRMVFDAVTRELHAGLARAFGLPALASNPFARTPTMTSLRQVAPTLPALGDAAAVARTLAAVADAAISMPPTEPRPEALPETNLFDAPPSSRATYARLRFVGQVRGTFLLCEGDDGLYVLDQHAAAERVTFERLRRAHMARSVAMQKLLVPDIVQLSAGEVALFEEQGEEVARLGVEIRAVGDTSVAIHGVPSLLARAQPEGIVRDLAAELSRSAGRSFQGAIDLVLATMACHGSIRAGDAMSGEEVSALLGALDEVDFAGHCPHGRPLVMRIAWTDLERRVGR